MDLTSGGEGEVDIVCRISDVGGSAKSDIDPFGIPGFYGISEIDGIALDLSGTDCRGIRPVWGSKRSSLAVRFCVLIG